MSEFKTFFSVFSETFYVPVMSWFSPLLADRATSRSTKERVTVVARQQDVTSHRIAKRRSLPTNFSRNDENYRHSKSGAIHDLKSRVQSDLDESFIFENRLQAAMMSDQ
jgi:hypothetical protein